MSFNRFSLLKEKMDMDRIKELISSPGIGAGVPIGGAAIAEICNNLIPYLTIISLGIGITVGLISLYLNIKKLKEK